MEINTILKTRDGRKIGNAIIIDIVRKPYTENDRLYVIKTDYGNMAELTEFEIKEFFYDPLDIDNVEIANVESHKNFDYKQIHREILGTCISQSENDNNARIKLWKDVWISVAGSSNVNKTDVPTNWANKALEAFDKKFKN